MPYGFLECVHIALLGLNYALIIAKSVVLSKIDFTKRISFGAQKGPSLRQLKEVVVSCGTETLLSSEKLWFMK